MDLYLLSKIFSYSEILFFVLYFIFRGLKKDRNNITYESILSICLIITIFIFQKVGEGSLHFLIVEKAALTFSIVIFFYKLLKIKRSGMLLEMNFKMLLFLTALHSMLMVVLITYGPTIMLNLRKY